jgi:epoxyqueuosine reductase
MLAANDGELLGAYGRWYIAHRDPRYLRRNALIVLGNSADGSSLEVEGALRTYLAHPDELLRAHAIWAAARLARGDVIESAQPALASDPSALVRDELERLGQVRPVLPRARRLLAE